MKILFLTSAHNSLSQRLLIELTERGHDIRVCVVATGEEMIYAVSDDAPDLIVAPMLKIAIPEVVSSRYLCLIVHPGIKGDRGPSSLDWAIANDEKSWGVSILEAAPEFDAGPIWASHEFPLEADPPAKSSLYRGPVTEAAVRGVLEAIGRIETDEFKAGSWRPEKLSDALSYAHGRLRPPMKQADRAIDWTRDNTATIVRKVRAADSAPGVLGSLLGRSCFLYGAHQEDRIKGPPGQILARRDGAICIGAVDGAVWISHLKAKGDPNAHEGACSAGHPRWGRRGPLCRDLVQPPGAAARGDAEAPRCRPLRGRLANTRATRSLRCTPSRRPYEARPRSAGHLASPSHNRPHTSSQPFSRAFKTRRAKRVRDEDAGIAAEVKVHGVVMTGVRHLAQSGIGCELCDMEFCAVAGIKLPATQVLGPSLRGVPETPLPIDAPDDHRTFREIVYTEEDRGRLSFVRFLQRGDEHGAVLPAARRISARPFTPDPGHRAVGRPRFLVERHPPQCDRGERRSGETVMAEHQRHRRFDL